jgi:hypothetical protein
MNRKLREFGEGIGGAFLIAVAFITPFSRYWRRWGATDNEVKRTLPGNDIVPHPNGGYTQAITVKCSRDDVWPWVAQVGQGRGGFYSYDFLENLVGCDIHTADRIVPEFQHDEKSEGIRLHPKMPPIPITLLEPGRVLLLGAKMDPDTPVSWLFYLDEINENTTRLISRWSFDYKPGLVRTVAYSYILEPIACVMQRKMLLGIRKRAENITSF